MNGHRRNRGSMARRTASADLQGRGGTGVTLLTTGTTFGLIRLRLPAGRWPARWRWDSTNLVASYRVSPDEFGVPIAMGSLDSLVPAIKRGEATASIQQAIWVSPDGTILYL